MKIVRNKNLRLFLFNKLFLIIYLLPFAGGFVLYYFQSESTCCLFMNLTNLPCPACGFSRAFIELTHLHLYNAIQYNFFIVLLAPLFIILTIIQILPATIKRKVYKTAVRNLNTINTAIIILVTLIILYDIIRILDIFTGIFNLKNVTPEKTILKSIFNFFR